MRTITAPIILCSDGYDWCRGTKNLLPIHSQHGGYIIMSTTLVPRDEEPATMIRRIFHHVHHTSLKEQGFLDKQDAASPTPSSEEL